MTELALERMPQKGPMLLIERVCAIDEDSIRCVAKDHRDADHPLRIEGVLETASLVELGAQAAAAHASQHGIGGRHSGLLLSLQGVEILAEPGASALDHAPLDVVAERRDVLDGAARYRFTVLAEDRPVLQGEAVMQMRGEET